MTSQILSKRLRAAADFVRKGSFVADVGTDHAYLPIALVKEGQAVGAVASDINEGPYLRAKKNISENELSDKIFAVHTDGLCGIEKYSPSDILICGMGGELIAAIIDSAPFTRDSSVRLILQPMTHPEILRSYLLGHGFSIIGEALVEEEKIYQIICAEYRGASENAQKYTEAELLLGKINIEKNSALLRKLADKHIAILKKIRDAKLSGENDASDEEKMIMMLEEIKNDCK